ncbi:hypothetical protein NEUTE1DRAFT_135481 [Neurospora tetrasperma FGSC 2508]|uniref:Uncharacterized protein n=1 Tax=Neurospora tetrasperma (strain FGSC 2508 / ATCC MYA-4615 / P0657) TaxID=510951 RepID=F8ME14_NEUT8|nr:uncharacterized protein NEUTE1DRAFT_135481 [Neurospora tetrasperma FGSC 2508]EGO61549.1 hypothetical protein NEUTE1DRAFT_135481 [Neurospora tetrasperma FGSC 2508]EGZ74412.1 hypothetical protein NEUTE2DRAFT_55410 [Neurospora tetrasperma FGSC 2509]
MRNSDDTNRKKKLIPELGFCEETENFIAREKMRLVANMYQPQVTFPSIAVVGVKARELEKMRAKLEANVF